MPLDRVDVSRQAGQDCSLISGARADLQDRLIRPQFQELGHPRDHVRLRDRLVAIDGQGPVRVGGTPLRRWDE